MTSWQAVSRRRVLTTVLGSSALAVTACGVPDALKKPPGLSASVRTLRASITAEQALVDSYHDVIRRFPQLSGRLNSFLAQHEQHLAQLRGRLVVPPHVTMSPIPSPSATSPAAAGSAEDAVQLLIRTEQLAASAQLGRLKGAPPALAQLLASIAASEATHAAALSAGTS